VEEGEDIQADVLARVGNDAHHQLDAPLVAQIHHSLDMGHTGEVHQFEAAQVGQQPKAGSQFGQQCWSLLLYIGGKAAWLHYRALGGLRWKSLPLSPVKGWVCQVVIPAAEIASPGLQFGFSFSADTDAPMAPGPIGVTVMPATVAAQRLLPRIPAGKGAKLTLRVRATAKFPAELSWNDLPAADFFKVYRDGEFLGDTAVTFFPDTPRTVASERDYRVEAWRDGKVIASARQRVRMPDGPVLEMPKVSATPQGDGLTLQWPALDTQYVTSFQVRLRRDAEGAPKPADTNVPAAGQSPSAVPAIIPAH
jgi:hypothetical protein